jgi:hypothetical protein
MDRRRTHFGLVLVSLGIAACSKAPKETDPPTPTVQSAVAPASASAAPSAVATPSSSNAYRLPPNTPSAFLPLGDRFAVEANDRPKNTARVEDVVAAMKAKGVPVKELQQHLASPFEAKYCMGVEVDVDIHLSICEYADEKTATSGREASLKAFSTVPGRSIYRNGATTLTVREGTKNAVNDATVAKMLNAFQDVKPPPAK